MKSLFAIIFILGSIAVQANIVSARLSVVVESEVELNIGDIANLKLVVWPSSSEIEYLISENIKAKDFIGGIFIVEVIGIERAPTNYEALIIEFKGIFTKKLDSYVLDLEEKPILIDLDDFVLEGRDYTDKPVVAIVNYSVKKYGLEIFIVALAFLLLLSLARLVKLKRIKKNEKKRILATQLILKNKLDMIEERIEVEEFLSKLKDYRDYLNFDDVDVESFTSYMEAIQYKKKWSVAELQSALQLIDIIRTKVK